MDGLLCRIAVTLPLSWMIVVPGPAGPAPAAAPVCAQYCDTRDPSQARQELFPVPTVNLNGRLLRLHVSDADAMAWASIDAGTLGNEVWLDRSWDGGATWAGLLGRAAIPGGWTGTRTLLYNISDPAGHRRGIVRACGNAGGVTCTAWAYPAICAPVCDATPAGPFRTEPVLAAGLSGRRIALRLDDGGRAYAELSNGRAGDEIWLDRSWDGGASWPGGSSLGRIRVAAGAASARTTAFHGIDAVSKLYGGALRACGRAVEGPSGGCTAWTRPGLNRVAAAADALMYAYQPNTAWWPSSWWNSAVATRTMIDYQRRTGDQRHRWMVRQTFDVNKGVFPAGVKSSDPIEGHFISRAVDDAAWWGLTWVSAYDLTGERSYLDEAVIIANYVHGYWDAASCNGGVWWNRERTYKNAVTNGLYIRLAAQLHNRIAGDQTWLSRARAGWQWFTARGMINASGLVNDGITLGCTNNGQPVWTYNQGLAIGAAVELWRATGDAALLATARRLADASTALLRDGVLTEQCDLDNAACDDNAKQFKGIFIGYAEELNALSGNAYSALLRRQADTVWTVNRDHLHRLGQRWSGRTPNVADWRTQASALSALMAAPAIQPSPPATAQVLGFAGKCADIPGSNAVDGQFLQLWQCNGTGAQSWTAGTDGTLRALGKCMDVAGGSLADGAVIQITGCNGGAAQQFTFAGAGTLMNVRSGKCVEVVDANPAGGAGLRQWGCSGAGHQRWSLSLY
jgi:hypothetical protein